MFNCKVAVQSRGLNLQPLESIRRTGGKKIRVYNIKFPGGRSGTTAAMPAGPVLSLEVSVVATTSLSLDCFSILMNFEKPFFVFRFFSFVFQILKLAW